MKLKKRTVRHLVFFVLIFISLILAEKSNAQATFSNSTDSGPTHGTTEKSVVVHIHKNGDNYTVNGLEMIDGQSDYQYDYQIYKGKRYNGGVISFSGKGLAYFPADQIILVQCVDNFDSQTADSGSCREVSEGDTDLRIPYFASGKSADIYNPKGEKILTIDLSSVAICNENGICDQPKEDLANCPFDCKTQVAPVVPGEQKISDTLEKQQKTVVASGGSNALLIVSIISFILIIIGVVIFWLKKRKKDDYI